MEVAISNTRKLRGRRPARATPVNVRFPSSELAALDAWIKHSGDGTSRPLAVRRLVEQSLGTSSPPKHNARMAPLKNEPPGMERDSKGNAIPLKQRTPDDRAKAKRGKSAKSGSAGHLPQRSDAVSGKAGRTPATPPKKAKAKTKRARSGS
jgi:hypothetical protein